MPWVLILVVVVGRLVREVVEADLMHEFLLVAGAVVVILVVYGETFASRIES